MGDEGPSPLRNPVQWLLRTSLLVLVAMLTLTWSVELLRDLLPWLVGIAGVLGAGWGVVALIRWRRSQW